MGFFAPDPALRRRPGAQCPRNSRTMVSHLHDAGLEVILDVVYNHTAEGNERGPTLSFKGIDNASYYRLLPDEQAPSTSTTRAPATRSTCRIRACLQMVTDSLRYWVSRKCMSTGSASTWAPSWPRAVNGFDKVGGFLEGCSAGPGPGERQADRRAVGLRAGRISGRRLPARLGRMERPVPRHGAELLEGRWQHRAADLARRLCGSGGHVQPPRPPAVGQRQLHHRP